MTLDKLTQKEQDFIYELGRKFITGYTMEEIAESIGISRRTAFNWQKKFKDLIMDQKVNEFSTIEDKVLKTAIDLLDSNKIGERQKGAELYFKTSEILQARTVKTIKNNEISTDQILKELGL